MTIRLPVRDVYLITNRDTSTNDSFAKLSMVGGTLTIDDGWAPRMQASIEVARPSLDIQSQMDPTLPFSRVRFVLRASTGGVLKRIDMKITARQIDASRGTIGLNLQSDEALLQDFGLVASEPDTTYWANQSSVTSIIFNVMNRALGVGNFNVSFDAGSASFPTYAPAENLVPNGSFENGSSAPWTPGSVSLSASTNWRETGVYSLAVIPLSGGTTNDTFAELGALEVEPGKTYTASGVIKISGVQTNANSRARSIWLYAIVDGQVIVLGQSPQALNSTTATTRASVTFTVPSNVSSLNMRLYAGNTNTTGGNVWWDNVSLVEGNGRDTNVSSVLPYFNGATPDTATYRYDWTGDAYASSSTRTPLIDRGPDALTWSPGQSAWDFLTPILQAVGWRLVPGLTDRTWAVKSVDTPPVGSPVSIAAGRNLYSLSDLISRTAAQSDGTPLFADAVLIHYTWTDSTTDEQLEAWESAGPSDAQKTFTVERTDTAYPGPGAAAYILSRLATRRRQLTVEAAEDYDPEPGREVVVTAPGADVISGVIDAITWDFTTGRMAVKTKGLQTVATGSIGRAPATQTIGSVTTDLASYTN